MAAYTNVYFDPASAYDISVVHERIYVEKLLLALSEIMQGDFQRFSFYILFSHNPALVPASADVKRTNKILLWFSDESGNFPHHLKEFYTVIFKSYITKEEGNVYTSPLGFVNEMPLERKNAVKKDIAVFFAGNTNANRMALYKLLFYRKFKLLFFLRWLPKTFSARVFKSLTYRRNNLSRKKSVFLFSHGFKSGLEYPQYYDYLLHSNFVLCPRGYESTETFRHTEALQAGCVVISEKMPAVSIYEGNPFLVYESYKELEEILRKVERDTYNVTELQERHESFYNRKLTLSAIAGHMSQICLSHKTA